MEVLEQNEIEKLYKLGCSPVFDCTQQLTCVLLHQCPAFNTCPALCKLLHHCTLQFWTCSAIYKCDGALFKKLTDSLTACGGEFFIKCPGFDEIGRVCEFEPAFDAAKWKEALNIDRISKLEAKVKELEMGLKRKV